MKKLTIIAVCLLVNTFYVKSQIISTIAGNGIYGTTGDGGQATAAELNNPTAIAIDVSGNIYFNDANTRIRKISTSGIIETIAGNGYTGYSGDGGPATAANLDADGVAVDDAGNVYIACAIDNVIRKVNTSGVITTIAGNGSLGYSGDGGPATAAEISDPAGIVVDGSGNIYIAQAEYNVIRKVNASGIISTFAGNGLTGGYFGDGGQATAANLWSPTGVNVDGSGNVYIVDHDNSRIRKVNTSGIISTVAGCGTTLTLGDGGPATAAQILDPTGVAVDGGGNVYISDLDNQRIRKVNTSGIISTFAGNGNPGYSGDGGPATAAEIFNPGGLAIDVSGNLNIADELNYRIRKVTHGSSAGITGLTVSRIAIYPNPTTGEILIEGINFTQIKVYNSIGQLIRESAKTNKLSIAESPVGLYMILLFSDTGELLQENKIIKE